MRLLLGVDSAVWGGAEACVAHLLQELPERFACTVLATDPVPPRLAQAAQARGALEVLPPVRGKGDVRGLLALDRLLVRLAPDVVHVNQAEPTNNRHLLGAAALRRIPAVPVLHLWSPVPASGVQSRVLRASYRSAARVVVVSRELRERVVQDLDVPQERVTVVRNGVADLPPAVRRDDATIVRLGALGRLVHHKGFDVLLRALRMLHDEGARVELHLAGDGPERAALERQATGLPVQFVGRVDDGPAFLSALDVFVLPSRDEGLPLTLLEAMTLGLPCAVTDVGDVREAVDATALVVAPEDDVALADALRSLVRDAQLRGALGDAARERARARFTAAAMARATAAVYDAVAR